MDCINYIYADYCESMRKRNRRYIFSLDEIIGRMEEKYRIPRETWANDWKAYCHHSDGSWEYSYHAFKGAAIQAFRQMKAADPHAESFGIESLERHLAWQFWRAADDLWRDTDFSDYMKAHSIPTGGQHLVYRDRLTNHRAID